MLVFLLLVLHIISGSVALLSAFIPIYAIKGGEIHKQYGRYFFYAMTIVFITAIPLALYKTNLFLFLIAVFSYYLALSGYRFGHYSCNEISATDKFLTLGMLTFSIFMMILGTFWHNEYKGIVLLIFGLIGCKSSWNDYKNLKTGKLSPNIRIIKHLQAMLGAIIAATTAFLVTNFKIQPELVVWITPTIIIVPVIYWWTLRYKQKPG